MFEGRAGRTCRGDSWSGFNLRSSSTLRWHGSCWCGQDVNLPNLELTGIMQKKKTKRQRKDMKRKRFSLAKSPSWMAQLGTETSTLSTFITISDPENDSLYEKRQLIKYRKNNVVKFVLTGSKDNTCRIWHWLKEAGRWARRQELELHRGQASYFDISYVFSFLFSPQIDCLYTVLSPTDKTIKMDEVTSFLDIIW